MMIHFIKMIPLKTARVITAPLLAGISSVVKTSKKNNNK